LYFGENENCYAKNPWTLPKAYTERSIGIVPWLMKRLRRQVQEVEGEFKVIEKTPGLDLALAGHAALFPCAYRVRTGPARFSGRCWPEHWRATRFATP
jgi:hypothetical protein